MYRQLPNNEQISNFEKFSKEFLEIYDQINSVHLYAVLPFWSEKMQELQDLLQTPEKVENFLKINELHSYLFMHDEKILHKEIQILNKKFSENQLIQILQESFIGNPFKINFSPIETTHNSVHHLYHLIRYMNKTKDELDNVKNIIEWGGGYGNFAKVFLSLKENVETYTIIDLPLFSCLQYTYLSAVYGKEFVNFVNLGNKIENNKINIMTSENLPLLKNINFDMFVSTWAISESPKIMQRLVIETYKWFNSSKLLLGFHQCGNHIPFMEESTNVGLAAKKYGALTEDVMIIPGKNFYAFKA